MSEVAVATSSRIAANAGAAIADRGGNAVDAALAAAMVSACTDVGIMSPAGSIFVTIWPPDQEPVVIDGCAEMPGRGQPPEKFGQALIEARFDYGAPTLQYVGFGSIATPGLFAGVETALARFGSLSLPQVLEPAIHWAGHGFPLTGSAAEYLAFTHEAIYSWYPASNAILHHGDGRPIGEGELVQVPELSATLQRMADTGSEFLYHGALARHIAGVIGAGGGLLSATDLAEYRVVQRVPLKTQFSDWTVATNPSPSVGGPCLAAMLCLLDRAPGDSVTAETVQDLIAAQYAVLSFRAQHLDGRPEQMPAEVARLLELAANGLPLVMRDAPSTIHVSAVDANGLACAVTGSAGYGSGVIVPGTGLWFNNSLGEVDLHTHGLSALRPGTRLPSNMAPSIARREDGAVIAIGSPGASRITTAIAQVLWHHIRHGQSLPSAVAWPRLHVEIGAHQSSIAFEPELPVTAFDGLALRPFSAHDMYFGGTNVACFDPVHGLEAVGDARRAGCAAYGGRS